MVRALARTRGPGRTTFASSTEVGPVFVVPPAGPLLMLAVRRRRPPQRSRELRSQLGRVGLSETEATRTGRKLLVSKRPMTRVGRAIEKGETKGFMKVVADAETKQVWVPPSWG